MIHLSGEVRVWALGPVWRRIGGGDSAKQEPREEVARPAQPLGHAPSSKLKPHALDASTWPGGGPGTDQTPLLPPRFAIPVPAPAESCGAPSSRYLLALLVTGGQPPAVSRQAGGPSSAMNSGCSLTNEVTSAPSLAIIAASGWPTTSLRLKMHACTPATPSRLSDTNNPRTQRQPVDVGEQHYCAPLQRGSIRWRCFSPLPIASPVGSVGSGLKHVYELCFSSQSPASNSTTTTSPPISQMHYPVRTPLRQLRAGEFYLDLVQSRPRSP